MVSTVWSVSCLLFFYSRCPLCPVICNSGAWPPVPHGVGATVGIHRIKPLKTLNKVYDGDDDDEHDEIVKSPIPKNEVKIQKIIEITLKIN